MATVGSETSRVLGLWVCLLRRQVRRRLRLVRDGVEVATTAGTTLEHRADGPGVYRVEAHRDARGRERTWILSNPIYLR